jgi:hypothetical protein
MYKYISIDDFEKKYSICIKNENEIPLWLNQHIFSKDPYANLLASTIDDLTPIKNGKHWLFELTAKHQPKTGELLLSNSNLSLYCHPKGEGASRHLVVNIKDKAIIISRSFFGNNPSDADYFLSKLSRNRLMSLPIEIREAYYWRFDGMDIPVTAAVGVYSRLLPFPIGRPWQSIDNYLKALKLDKKWLPIFAKWNPLLPPIKQGEAWTNFMCFLDTRPTLSGLKGDVFFVNTTIINSPIYHIHDGDIKNMKILKNYKEAIDEYCYNLLLNNRHLFDFTKYDEEYLLLN